MYISHDKFVNWKILSCPICGKLALNGHYTQDEFLLPLKAAHDAWRRNGWNPTTGLVADEETKAKIIGMLL
jgi:hypothetical protein